MNDYVEKERATREREKLPEKSAAVGGHSKIFAERKQSGLFVQDLILELSDIIIVVVGDMGLEDQEYLFAILRERERVPKLLKEVLVVHNLAHINNKLETVEAFEVKVPSLNLFFLTTSLERYGEIVSGYTQHNSEGSPLFHELLPRQHKTCIFSQPTQSLGQ